MHSQDTNIHEMKVLQLHEHRVPLPDAVCGVEMHIGSFKRVNKCS